jgi:hypothetical protein
MAPVADAFDCFGLVALVADVLAQASIKPALKKASETPSLKA